jgi:hypothetical protein
VFTGFKCGGILEKKKKKGGCLHSPGSIEENEENSWY